LALYSDDPDPERALDFSNGALAVVVDDDYFIEAVVLHAEAQLASGEGKEAARTTLAELDHCRTDHSELLARSGELLFSLGEVDRAERAYRAALAADDQLADAYYGLGKVLEERQDYMGMVVVWLKTLELDRESPPPPFGVSEEELAAIAEKALAELPRPVLDRLENVPVMIAEWPSEDLVRQGVEPRLLGLFSGLPLPHKSHLGGQQSTLDTIHLFHRNLESIARNADELAEEIRITVLHETAHFFGLEDEDLEEIGLG